MPRDLETPSPDMADAIEDRRHFYPTRLLDLQAFDSGCLDIKLIEEPVAGNSFATLSHCWGVNCVTKYQTTTWTLRDHRDRILYTSLPKTYLDAVMVCRSLSIRYLWIDSLCIIQDSREDWAREAASMSDVYSNSHLTISADWSPSPEGGCFKSIDAPPAFKTEETVCIANVLSSGQQSRCLYLPSWDLSYHSLLESTHLAGRAWAFQERLLSRRNLHFTQHQLFWECREGFAGEDGVPRAHKNLKPNKFLTCDRKKSWKTSSLHGAKLSRLTPQPNLHSPLTGSLRYQRQQDPPRKIRALRIQLASGSKAFGTLCSGIIPSTRA